MPDSELVTLRLNAVHAAQILDLLREKAGSWERTGALLKGEIDPQTADFLAEDCAFAHEAENMAAFLSEIAASVQEQLIKWKLKE